MNDQSVTSRKTFHGSKIVLVYYDVANINSSARPKVRSVGPDDEPFEISVIPTAWGSWPTPRFGPRLARHVTLQAPLSKQSQPYF